MAIIHAIVIMIIIIIIIIISSSSSSSSSNTSIITLVVIIVISMIIKARPQERPQRAEAVRGLGLAWRSAGEAAGRLRGGVIISCYTIMLYYIMVFLFLWGVKPARILIPIRSVYHIILIMCYIYIYIMLDYIVVYQYIIV